ncbi:MAG: hypothetical protein IME93_01585, partial [Proteobacteria bacterium]|nr:hypothetical protein [Pseudomonadota bacterium]
LKEELTSAKDSLNQASSDLSQSFQDEMHAIDPDAEPESEYLLKAIEGAEEKNADEGADSDNSKPDKAPASPRDDSKAAK